MMQAIKHKVSETIANEARLTKLGFGNILAKLGTKLANKKWYPSQALIASHVIVVEYNNIAKERGVTGDEFLVLKHYKQQGFHDIIQSKPQMVEPFSYHLLEHYKKRNVFIHAIDQPEKLPFNFEHRTIHHVSASQL
jgi:hypothetical protein